MVTVNGEWAEFRFFRPHARRVHLLGDFNNWAEGELAMSRTSAGYWVARIRLGAGVFKFRYYADGKWFVDYAAFGIEYSPFGVDGLVRIRAAADRAKGQNSDGQLPGPPRPEKTSGGKQQSHE